MRRILVVKLSSIGDVVHAIPSVAALAARFPQARIDWLVETPAAPVVRALPWVSEAIVYDGEASFRRGWGDFRAARRRAADALAAAGYDLAVDLQGLLRSSLFTIWSGAARRAGRGRWPWLHAGVPMYDRVATPHAIENTARILEPLGASLEKGWELARPFLSAWGDVLGTRGRALALELGLRRRFRLFVPRASRPAKSLELAWIEEAVAARDAGADAVIGDSTLASYRPAVPAIVNLAGRLTLLDAVSLALAADEVVSADTGPAQLAALLGARITACHGPTSPDRTGLRGPRARSLAAPCGGCENPRCPSSRRCLRASFLRALESVEEAGPDGLARAGSSEEGFGPRPDRRFRRA